MIPDCFFFVPKNWNGVVLPFHCVLELGSGNWVVEHCMNIKYIEMLEVMKLSIGDDYGWFEESISLCVW